MSKLFTASLEACLRAGIPRQCQPACWPCRDVGGRQGQGSFPKPSRSLSDACLTFLVFSNHAATASPSFQRCSHLMCWLYPCPLQMSTANQVHASAHKPDPMDLLT